ncbi:MAG TPA: glycosyltransferase family 2 protein [Candidatus Methylomirabilis sp.]|nr:glycosyltransferase family 2 protein [Candidatus Methylomirabilis sp.]
MTVATKGGAALEATNCSPSKALPKISLITPVWNSAKYIEDTIRSVLSQNYPNLEYFIVDGGSTDGTLEIIPKYETQITGWITEPDNGMYDALNKGFAKTSGEIMGWISATDMLQPGGLLRVGEIFRDLPAVEWIAGRPVQYNEAGDVTEIGGPPRWARLRYLAGANRYIQQESTYWRRSLWERAGSRVDSSRRNGSDSELWIRFFRHARLYAADARIGGFRMHADSLALRDLAAFDRILDELIDAELKNMRYGHLLKLFRAIGRVAEKTAGLKYLWWRFVTNPLYSRPGRDWAPVIRLGASRGWYLEE